MNAKKTFSSRLNKKARNKFAWDVGIQLPSHGDKDFKVSNSCL